MQGRSPEAKDRIINSLTLIEEAAHWIACALGSLAEGEEPDDDRLGANARKTADEIAAKDGKTVPGF